MDAPITRTEAIVRLSTDRAALSAILEQVSRRDLERAGLGGGDWSPKDLIGHLAAWEEHGLGALDAWARGMPAPVEVALRQVGLTRVNRDELLRKAPMDLVTIRRDAARVHANLIAAIEVTPDDRWVRPPVPRARLPLGTKLGRILAGAGGPFHHDAAHLPDLRAFVRAAGGDED
jgi:hypothetical protein